MKANSAHNLVEAARIVRRLGGTSHGVEAGGKHLKIQIITPRGNPLVLLVSKGRSDPHNLFNFIRQQINRADAKAERTRTP